MEYKKCIIHFRNGKTYLVELSEETSVEDLCNSILPICSYQDEEDNDFENIDYQTTFLKENYALVKLSGGGDFIFDRYEVLGLEFI